MEGKERENALGKRQEGASAGTNSVRKPKREESPASLSTGHCNSAINYMIAALSLH